LPRDRADPGGLRGAPRHCRSAATRGFPAPARLDRHATAPEQPRRRFLPASSRGTRHAQCLCLGEHLVSGAGRSGQLKRRLRSPRFAERC
jgi:hypothetical protein